MEKSCNILEHLIFKNNFKCVTILPMNILVLLKFVCGKQFKAFAKYGNNNHNRGLHILWLFFVLNTKEQRKETRGKILLLNKWEFSKFT